MKKSTRFVATRNYSLTRMKQFLSSIAHSLRISTNLAININQEKIKDNKIEIINLRDYMRNDEIIYTSLNYELNKLETDLTYILDFKNDEITFDEIQKVLTTGDNLLSQIKNINIDKNKIDIIKMMMSRVKTKIQEIEIETAENENDISTNSKEHKTTSRKQQIKKAKDEIFKLEKEKLLEDIQKLDETTQKKLMFEMKQLENIENLIKEMINEHNSKDDNNSKDLLKIRESVKSTRKRLEGKDMGLSLENFDKFYDDNIEKTDEEIATEYINLNWDNSKYKENMNEGFKKRTIESLINYTSIKDKKRNINKDEIVSGTKTVVQELLFNPVSTYGLMTKEEVEVLRDKIIQEETAKGNFVLLSAIHNDESSPHIHIFIMSKDFNIMNNQIDFINKKYGTEFNPYNKMTKKEQEEYGRIQQDHFYDLMNSVMTEDRKFVRKHLLDTTEIDLIKDLKVKEGVIEQKDLLRKNENNVIKIRKDEKIDKRTYNNENQKIEKNLEKFDELNKELEKKVVNYQNNLILQKQKSIDDLDLLKSRFNKEQEEEKKQWEEEKIEWEEKKLQELKIKVKEDFLKNETKLIKQLNEKKDELKEIENNLGGFFMDFNVTEILEITENLEKMVDVFFNGFGITKEEKNSLLLSIDKETKHSIPTIKSTSKRIIDSYNNLTYEEKKILKSKANPTEFVTMVTETNLLKEKTKKENIEEIKSLIEKFPTAKIVEKDGKIFVNGFQWS